MSVNPNQQMASVRPVANKASKIAAIVFFLIAALSLLLWIVAGLWIVHRRAALASIPQIYSRTAVIGTIKPADPSVASAIPAGDLTAARAAVGKPGSFQGVVTTVYHRNPHGVMILDFAQNYRTAATAVVEPVHLKDLPRLGYLKGKRVLVTGTWTNFSGRMQIEVTQPSQIEVIQ